ncbi:bifunctional hydroxymethylpyrimidine kinase/phosphomethylpyrimidine kinase [Rubrivirga sp. IMCC45206]|uniref:bifunctional hydroxymethylpyrimidine kinase/phosphomethylpyrimidine kinase n=1 Tax=Rubrivirga sp. IMCC45206 TaxID=3391614 RepID=UPI00398FC4D5
MSLLPIAVIGAAYTATERGIAADVLVARSLGLAPFPVITSIVVASGGRVTDVTDVPVDTVIAQLEHLAQVGPIRGVKVGILGSDKTAVAVLDALAAMDVPTVLDLVASGPSGETVLEARGIDAVADRLGAARLVTLSKADAELVTNTQIESLDDAQVAAQRLHNRGAAHVLIRCGSLPYRFYDAADDPGADGQDRLFADLYYDGEDFALYEAPLLDGAPDGAASGLAITALKGLIEGQHVEEALQGAKRYATEAVRHAVGVDGHASRLGVDWMRPSA